MHLCRAQVICLDPERDILSFRKTVVSFLELSFQHLTVFPADPVVCIPFFRDLNIPGEILHIGSLVNKGQLHMDRSVKIVEEITVSLKDLRFIIRLRQLIIDIVKLYCLCIGPVIQSADPIPVHLPVRDTLLDCLRGIRAQTEDGFILPRRPCA